MRGDLAKTIRLEKYTGGLRPVSSGTTRDKLKFTRMDQCEHLRVTIGVCTKDTNNFDPSFDFQHRGQINMKGKSESMGMWLLTRRGQACEEQPAELAK